jgi:hypothetical protein
MKTNIEQLLSHDSKVKNTYQIKICHRTQLIKTNEKIFITRFNVNDENEVQFEIIN